MYVRASGAAPASQTVVEAVLAHVRERVELVQLSVVKENETAQRLYRSCGSVAHGHEAHALSRAAVTTMKRSWPSHSIRESKAETHTCHSWAIP